jgi:hypothetical protein
MLTIPDVQAALKKLGYFDGEVDGDYQGANFRDDLRRFQRDYPAAGAADGWYGPKTNAVLEPILGELRQRAPAAVQSMRRWHMTHYYVGDVRPHGQGNVPLYNDKGEVLERVAARAFVEASLEGSSRLRDGRLINVAGWRPAGADRPMYDPVLSIARQNGWLPQKPGYAGLRVGDGKVTEVRTFAVKKPGPKGWPICAKNIECDPYRTVAADNGILPRHDPAWKGKGGVVPAGTRVFILELAGVKLPDNTTHDGWVTVNDTGGGIFGAHFDIFTGTRVIAQSQAGKRVPVYGRAHIWFEGIEGRLPFDYAYGLP